MRLSLLLFGLTIISVVGEVSVQATDAVWVHAQEGSGDESSAYEDLPPEEAAGPVDFHFDDFHVKDELVACDGFGGCAGKCECASSCQCVGPCDCQNHCHCGSGECYGVDTDPGRPRKPHRTMPGDRNRGDHPPLRYRICDCKRTGHSQAVAPWAICGRPQTHFGRYTAWFVGGGAAFADVPGLSDLGCKDDLIPRGRDRKAIGCGQHGEGTWGLDYEGFAGHAKVWLKYTKGFSGKGRPQGGEGAYRTDGEPKIVAKLKEALHHH